MKRISHRASGFICLFLCSIVLCGFCPIAAAQSNLNGYWDLRIPSPDRDGTFSHTYFHLQQDGTAISGQLIRGHHELPIAGTFEHESIHFATKPPASAPKWEQRPVVFEGTGRCSHLGAD